MSVENKLIAQLEETIATAKQDLQALLMEHQRTTSKQDRAFAFKLKRDAINKEKYAINNGLSVHKLRLAGNRVTIAHIRYVSIPTQDGASVLQPVPSYLRNFHEFTPYGGATHISITTPENKEYLTSSFCHLDDGFDYKMGVKRALESFSQAEADKLLLKK